jgi:hypothetical protein
MGPREVDCFFSIQRGETLACSSFASTNEKVVTTEAAHGLVPVFLRARGVVEEVACISTLDAEVGWGE